MFDIAEEVFARAGIKGHVGTELPYCVIKNPQKYKHLQIASLCAGGKEFFVIDPSGYVKVCNHSPHRCCKWTELETLNDNEYWMAFASKAYIPDMCKDCEHLDICDGGCRESAHVFYGSINAPDPCFEVK